MDGIFGKLKIQIPLRKPDGDGDIPGEIKPNVRLVQQACENKGISSWTLLKRTIENYIPDETLDAWIPYPDSEKGKCVAAIKRLDKDQRDHYPMKKGLKIAKAKSSVQALYTDLVIINPKKAIFLDSQSF